MAEDEAASGDEERILRSASALNPWVAEPHVMLAQLLFRDGRYEEAAHEAAEALDLFYTLASCWDKRIPFRQWVGFTRLLLLRSSRKAAGEESMPFRNDQAPNFHHGPLVGLKQLVTEMNSHEHWSRTSLSEERG